MPSGLGMYRNDMPQPLSCNLCCCRQRSVNDSSIRDCVTLHDVRIFNSARHRTRIPADMRFQLRSQVIRKSKRIIHIHYEHHDDVPAHLRNIRIHLRTRNHQFLQKRRPSAHHNRNTCDEMAVHLLPSHRTVNIDEYAAPNIKNNMASDNIINVPPRHILHPYIIHRATITWIARC